jgi:hypothetical protein
MEWISVKDRLPNFNIKVRVRLDDNEETTAFLDDNYNRSCWLIKGTGGSYWRSFTKDVIEWQEI